MISSSLRGAVECLGEKGNIPRELFGKKRKGGGLIPHILSDRMRVILLEGASGAAPTTLPWFFFLAWTT